VGAASLKQTQQLFVVAVAGKVISQAQLVVIRVMAPSMLHSCAIFIGFKGMLEAAVALRT
jgi:hypothetical protein